jgi:hypothetical protein
MLLTPYNQDLEPPKLQKKVKNFPTTSRGQFGFKFEARSALGSGKPLKEPNLAQEAALVPQVGA